MAMKKDEIGMVEAYLGRYEQGTQASKFPGRLEDDRKSVSIAIKRSIANIGRSNPVLADHLRDAMRHAYTSTHFSFRVEEPKNNQRRKRLLVDHCPTR